MRFLKLSLLLSTSFFLNFNNSWAMEDEAERALRNVHIVNNPEGEAERGLRNVHIINNPGFRAGDFPVTAVGEIFYTDFFMGGITRTDQPQNNEERTPLFREISVSISRDNRCKIVRPGHRAGRQEIILNRYGRDGRTPITSTKELPYRFHGHMIMTFANGKSYTASGTLVGPHHVLTAGHNLFSHKRGEG